MRWEEGGVWVGGGRGEDESRSVGGRGEGGRVIGEEWIESGLYMHTREDEKVNGRKDERMDEGRDGGRRREEGRRIEKERVVSLSE